VGASGARPSSWPGTHALKFLFCPCRETQGAVTRDICPSIPDYLQFPSSPGRASGSPKALVRSREFRLGFLVQSMLQEASDGSGQRSALIGGIGFVTSDFCSCF
jgi:hypothetical protein